MQCNVWGKMTNKEDPNVWWSGSPGEWHGGILNFAVRSPIQIWFYRKARDMLTFFHRGRGRERDLASLGRSGAT